jgi:Phosphopantetheine attachment site
MATVDSVHEELCHLLAGMMGTAAGHAPPRPHASFMALGGSEAAAAELTRMVNALFGLDLPEDTALRSPTPDALARTIEIGFGGSASELVDLIDAIADAA